MNALHRLGGLGHGFWLDGLSREVIEDGSLARRIREQGLSGATTRTDMSSGAVAGAARAPAQAGHGTAVPEGIESAGEPICGIADAQAACDLLLPVHDESRGRDGLVSVEVSPHLAHDVDALVGESRALAAAVARPNFLVKVPATAAGLQATERLLYDGVSCHLTLLFSVTAYREALDAYVRALERRWRDGRELCPVKAVAGLSLAAIDAAVDRELRHRTNDRVNPLLRGGATALLGQTAIATARMSYQVMEETLAAERWQVLEKQGAGMQRLAWEDLVPAAAGQPRLRYVESLLGPRAISVMPGPLADAFDAHGSVESTLRLDPEGSATVLRSIGQLGIDLDAIGRQLAVQALEDRMRSHEARPGGRRTRPTRSEQPATAGPLTKVAARLRAKVVEMTTAAGSGHPTSCLSCAELVAALFFHEMRWDPATPGARDMDRFLLSKGHAAPVLWAALHEAGAITTDLSSLRQLHSELEGHPTPESPWVPVATGSLGQGLAIANGMALADRLDGFEARTFCLLGDGECSEGSVWEAAQFAADNKLAQIVAIVDANGLQQSGPAPYGHDTAVLARRFRAFGWRSLEIDGHAMGEILDALEAAHDGGPTAIVARTVKGRGVSFLEGKPGWHGKALDPQQCEQALREIAAPAEGASVTARNVPGGAQDGRPARIEPIAVSYQPGDRVATRHAFGAALVKLGGQLPDLVVLDGDVKNSTSTDGFADAFAARFIEAEIAEQNMVGVALGLAASGKLPCVATFAAFLTRAHDFIRMAAHSRPAHLVFCGSHAGVSIGPDGPSQMGLEDIAMFRALDGATVLYPCDAVSAERLTELAVATPGIVYLRTTRGATPVIYGADETFAVGGSKVLAQSERDSLTLVAAGITVHTALAAHQRLSARGLHVRVIDAYSVSPLDHKTLQRAARETGTLLVVEDHSRQGGLGEAVAAQIGRLARVFHLGVAGEPHSATPAELLELHRLSSHAIEQEALAVAAA